MLQVFWFYGYDLMYPKLYIHHVLVHVFMYNRNYYVSTFFIISCQPSNPLGVFLYVVISCLCSLLSLRRPNLIAFQPPLQVTYIDIAIIKCMGNHKRPKHVQCFYGKRGSKRLEIGGCKWTWGSYKIETKFYKIWYLDKDSRTQCQLS